MAKLELRGIGNFNQVLTTLHKEIIEGSISASLEETSNSRIGDVQIAVRGYERYSYFGGNRVSLTLTLVGNQNDLFLSLITTGGSQAVFFKINRVGENAFLNPLISIAKGLIK